MSTKYPRSLHAQISLGTTSDDRFIPDGYVEKFSNLDLIITEKLDGSNLCFSKQGMFGRSHAAPTQNEWDKPLMPVWEKIKHDLGDLEIFGESMVGVHSIEYSQLTSYFYVFAIRQFDQWLSWEEVKFYAAMLDFPTVPEMLFTKSLKNLYTNQTNENIWLEEWLSVNLGMKWENYTNTSGNLGGFDPKSSVQACEGFVIRDSNSFKINAGLLPVASNEFDSIIKLVRKKHVKTDEHWTRNWKRASLNWEKIK